MDKRIIRSLLFLLLSAGMNFSLPAQEMTLTGESVLHLKSGGMPVSAGAMNLTGASQLKRVEMLLLTGSDYIRLKSPDARLLTGQIMRIASFHNLSRLVGMTIGKQL